LPSQVIYSKTFPVTTPRQKDVFNVPYVGDLTGLKLTASLTVTTNANGAVTLTNAGEWAGLYELKIRDGNKNEAVKLHGPEIPIVRRHFASGIQKVYVTPAGSNASIAASSTATYSTVQDLRLAVKGPNLLELTYAEPSDITTNTGNISSASVTLTITAEYGAVARTLKLSDVVLPPSVQGDNNIVPYLTGADGKELDALILFNITESDFNYFTQKSGSATLVDQANLSQLESEEASVFPQGHITGTLDILAMYPSVVAQTEQLIINWNTSGLMPTAIYAYSD
jgi:hypothetical protein